MKKGLFVFLLVFLVACSDKPVFSEKVIEKTSEDCQEDCFSVNFSYLVCKKPTKFATNFNKEIELQIVNFLLNQTDSTKIEATGVEQALEIFMKDYNNLHEHFPDIPPYELILNDTISFQNEKMVSIASNRYSYTGGAHGISSTVFLNFDASNGELIEREELFTNFPKVLEIAEQYFRKEQNIPSSGSVNEKGFWFENDKFQLPQNVGVSEKFLILYYNPYEIAPYVDGVFEVRIPIEEIKAYLRY